MCITCGCLNPTDNHGDERNITIRHLQKAGEAQKISIIAVLKNILKTLPVIIKNIKTYAN